jgi:hypothetical protein
LQARYPDEDFSVKAQLDRAGVVAVTDDQGSEDWKRVKVGRASGTTAGAIFRHGMGLFPGDIETNELKARLAVSREAEVKAMDEDPLPMLSPADIDGMQVNALKEALRVRGCALKGNKVDLQERLKEAEQKRFAPDLDVEHVEEHISQEDQEMAERSMYKGTGDSWHQSTVFSGGLLEVMRRGHYNEIPARAGGMADHLKRSTAVWQCVLIYRIGLVARRDQPYLAVSVDAIALLYNVETGKFMWVVCELKTAVNDKTRHDWTE